MIDLKKLIAVSTRPSDDSKEWLENAEVGVDYLIEQLRADDTIIYASLEATLVQGVLAPRVQVTPADHEDLLHAMIMPDSTWSISHESGGGEPDRVYLASSFDSAGCKSLVGGEKLVTRRTFHSVDKGKTRTEVNQRLVHALDLYWLDEETAYCRLDDNGDIEPVIRVIDLEGKTGKASDIVVTILARDLARYMVITNTALLQKFDFTRFIPGKFMMWGKSGETRTRGADLFYTVASQSNASYANGVIVSRTGLTHAALVLEYQGKWSSNDKQYATFKSYDWKNAKIDEISCAPSALASYLEQGSPLPYQITPAFFRPDVLQRYKADPEKYTLEHRSLSSRAGWSLKTYDINEAGQVHTYLHYLGDLPYQEQLYWQSFNEWPKASISKRAYETDIQGNWTKIPDPLVELISEVRSLDASKPDWWQERGDDLRATTHYPITTSPDEWGDSILALDQLLVEGYATKPIRARLAAAGCVYEKEWQSLRLIQELLTSQGYAPSDAADALEPLRTLHFFRSKVKGHAAPAARQQLIKQARADHGSLKDHFLQLAFDCQEAFEKANIALKK